jgi:hypothetical protein
MAVVTDALQFALDPEHHKRAAAALAKHGSLRKAAAATGIPHTTIHYWKQHGMLDAAMDKGAAAASTELPDAPRDPEIVDDLAQVGDMDPALPDGNPQTLSQVANVQETDNDIRVHDGTTAVPDAPVVQWPQYPNGGFQIQGLSGTQDWMPDSPAGLRALMRYANSLISGARPDNALRAAQMVDPDFGLTSGQDERLMHSISQLLMSENAERLYFAGNPPGYVRSVYDQYAMDQNDQAALSSELRALYEDSYIQAINDNLVGLGRDPISMITDPALLAGFQQDADAAAAGIAETFNRDLATQVGTSWVDLSAQRGTQMSRQWLDDATNQFITGRSDWKAEQIAITESTSAWSDAQQDWSDRNPQAIAQVRVTPADAVCAICQAAVDAYGEWTDAADFDGFDPPHPGCVHSVEYQAADLPDSTPVWDGQDGAAALAVTA